MHLCHFWKRHFILLPLRIYVYIYFYFSQRIYYKKKNLIIRLLYKIIAFSILLGDEEILEWIINEYSKFNKIRPIDIGEIQLDNLADELIDVDIDYFTKEAWGCY